MKTKRQIENRERAFFPSQYQGKLRYLSNPFSPMVFLDFCLIVALFFITIHYSQLVLRPGIEMQLPSAKFRSGISYNKFDTILITLSREGMVFFNDELTTLEGLEASISRTAHENPDVKMLIQADAKIGYGTIVKIYNMATRAGIENVTMATSIAAGKPFAE